MAANLAQRIVQRSDNSLRTFLSTAATLVSATSHHIRRKAPL